MGVAVVVAPADPVAEAGPGLVRSAGEQLGVASGQLGAGLGNLGFALVMARVLDPASFARLAAFLALYVLLGIPTTSLSAATALSPARSRRLDRQVSAVAVGAGLAAAGAAPWLAPVLHLGVGAVVSLGGITPAVGVLALDRGRLYGSSRHVALVSSLLTEPGVRLTLGVGAAALFGATGADVAVVVAAYAAVVVARRSLHPRRVRPGSAGTLAPSAPPSGAGRAGGAVTAGWTAAAFLLLAVIQNQDLILANGLLPADQAGRFAVLSTLGGAAAFATLTVPLVLLPRAARLQRRALPAALGVAGLIGAVVVGLTAAAPRRIVSGLFGPRYAPVAGLAAVYLGGMALLGLSRVVVAHWTTSGRQRTAVALTAAAAAAQGLAIGLGGRTVGAVALATVGATAGLTAGLAGAEVAWRWRDRRLALYHPDPGAVAAPWWTRPSVRIVAGLLLGGLAVRLLIPRGLWLDEATSVLQARMHFGAMLSNLRNTDVHPPGWYALLWVTVRLFGSSELAVRLPSIAAGTLLVPLLYLTGKELYDRRTGYVAAAIGAVSPFLVWYSQEARMYSQLMLFAVVAVWAQVRALRRGGTWAWVVYTLASAGLVWTQYFGSIQVVVQQAAFGLAALRRAREGRPVAGLLGAWFGSLVGIAALVGPLVPFALHQFMVNQRAGKGFGALTPSQAGNGASSAVQHLSIYSLLANVVWIVWGYHSDSAMEALVALWPIGMLAALFVLGRKRQPETSLLLAACAVPIITLFGIGFVKRDLFDARYFSGAAALSVLLVARFITGGARRRRAVAVAACGLIGALAFSLFDQQTNGSNPRTYSFREAMQMLNRTGQAGDTVLYAPRDIGTVVGYYDRGHYRLRQMSTDVSQDEAAGRIFVVVSPRLMSPGQPGRYGRVLQTLSHQHHLEKRMHLDNVEIWEFS